MNSSPTVSVSLVTYNHEAYVADAIRSILDQTFTDLELVVVDDGSTDRTPEIVASFADPRIVSIRQPNGGPSAATNRALAACRGKYVALMTGDDISVPHRIQTQLAMYGDGPPRVLFSGLDFIDDAGQPLTEAAYTENTFDTSPQTRAQILRRFFVQGNFINGVSAFTERRLFQEMGPFDPSLYLLQDFDMWIRFVKKYGIEFDPQSLIRYRIRGDGGNLSNPTPGTLIRHDNEHFLIMRRFFDDGPDDLFRKAFRAELRRPDLDSALATECEKAFLFMESPRQLLRYIGMEMLQRSFQHPDTSAFLAREFQFPLAAFVSRLTEVDPFDRFRDNASHLFVDTGGGFVAGQFCCTTLAQHGRKFRVRFDLSDFGDVRALRWDPVACRLCRVKLERATWHDEAGACRDVDLSAVTANGHRVGPCDFDFDTFLPMIFLPVSGSVRSLTLEGTWSINDRQTTFARLHDMMTALRVPQVQAAERIRDLEAKCDELRGRAAAAEADRNAAEVARTRVEALPLVRLVTRLRSAWRPLKSSGVFSS